jgi:hypothetical protein
LVVEVELGTQVAVLATVEGANIITKIEQVFIRKAASLAGNQADLKIIITRILAVKIEKQLAQAIIHKAIVKIQANPAFVITRKVVFEVKIQAGLELVIGNLVASATLVKPAAE